MKLLLHPCHQTRTSQHPEGFQGFVSWEDILGRPSSVTVLLAVLSTDGISSVPLLHNFCGLIDFW